MKIHFQKILFIFVILLAIFLRIFRIDHVPARMTHDEMSFAYNAYSILKTGKDEWGEKLPLVFQSFGDYKQPLYIYASVPFIALMGLNPLSARIVSIISGVLIIILIYFIVLFILKNKLIALLSAFMMAISPWAIHLSRMAFDSHIALLMFVLGMLLLIMSHRLNNKKLAMLGGICWGLTAYSYVAYRLLIFIMGVWLLVNAIIKKYRKTILIFMMSMTLSIIPLIGLAFSSSGLARFNSVSIFKNEGISMQVNEKRAYCYLSQQSSLSTICKILYNKYIYYVSIFIGNWISFLSPSFLFVSGNSNLNYLSVPGYGEFIFILAPFYVVGLVIWFLKKGFGANLVKISYLVAPIPSSLTGETQIVRGSCLLPFIVIFTATGVVYLFSKIHKIKARYFLSILFSLLITVLFLQYYIDYQYIYPSKYDDAAYPLDFRVAEYVHKNESMADKIIIDKDFPDSYILFAFYNQINPEWLQHNIVRNNVDQFGFSHPNKLGKMEFVDNPMSLVKNYLCQKSDQNYIFITKPYLDIPNTDTIYNFAHVHPQVSIFNTMELRKQLQSVGTYGKFCGMEQTL